MSEPRASDRRADEAARPRSSDTAFSPAPARARTTVASPDPARRAFLRAAALGTAGVGALAGGLVPVEAEAQRAAMPDDGLGDFALLNLVLSLEHLQFELYNHALHGSVDLGPAFSGSAPGEVIGGGPMTGVGEDLAALVAECADLEARHITVLRAFFDGYGRSAVDRPAIDFVGGFRPFAGAAGGLGGAASPFASADALILCALLVEDIAVSAYTTILERVVDPNVRTVLHRVTPAEGYQAGALRMLARQRGLAAEARAIAALEARLRGTEVIDPGAGSGVIADAIPTDFSGFIPADDLGATLGALYAGRGRSGGGGFFPEGIVIGADGRRI